MMDLDALVDREVGAMLVGVKPRTIESWVDRGHLTRTATGPRGKALYRVGALLDAERTTRKSSRRQVRRLPRQLAG